MPACLLLLHATVCDEVVKQLSALRVLHHQEDFLVKLDHLEAAKIRARCTEPYLRHSLQMS